MKRTKKPKKPASAYSAEEIKETAVYQNLVAVLPSLPEHEAVRLARAELESMWADLNRARVNKACDVFRDKLAKLGIEGKTIHLTLVSDRRGNYYYDVRAEKGGARHDSNAVLPTGTLKVLSLKQ